MKAVAQRDIRPEAGRFVACEPTMLPVEVIHQNALQQSRQGTGNAI
jgi:hypothetical protein